MSPTLIYLARHGLTASNLARRYAGRSAEPLLEAGRERIAGLAADLGAAGITAIWSSEVRRAQETAEILGGKLGVPVTLDSRLNELQMGPWEGLTESDVASRYPDAYRLWLERPDRLRLDNRETLSELGARVQSVLSAAVANPGLLLLVSHVAPIRVVILQTLGLPLSAYKSLQVETGACFVLNPQQSDVKRFGASSSVREEFGTPGHRMAGDKER